MSSLRNLTFLTKGVCFVLLILTCAYGQESSRVTENGREVISWADLDGQVVTVDGLVWGTFGKGLGRKLILTNGYKVYLHGEEFNQAELDGCLLRICGVLQKKRMEKAPPGAQGYGGAFDYYTIDIVSSERIDRVEKDQLLPSPGDWIKPGMSWKAASELLVPYGFPAYKNALPPLPDRSVPHAYQISEQQVLVIYELKGQVRTVARVRLNGQIKGKTELEELAAYLLPLRESTVK